MHNCPRRLLRRGLRLLAVAALLGGATAWADDAFAPASLEFFEKQVRPLLVQHCGECHGAKKQEGALRLDSRASVLKGGDLGVVVVPGKPEESLLVKAIHRDGDLQMPPDDKLPDEAIAALSAWIRDGVAWPAEAPHPPLGDPRELAARHWSFQPVRSPLLPAVTNSAWPSSPLDHFVLAKLEAAGLAPSPPADRRALIRRASYDLVGLPPTADEVDRFVADAAPDAFEQVIDRLLASPAYGERWARYWLDVARYADSKGYVFTEDRRYPFAYTYRDWLIRALNRDLPYDQFLTRQLAADAAPEAAPGDVAALGFLTLGRRFLNNRHDIIDDRIDVVMRGTQGLTVGCARCHDHKFDPIPMADYYSLYGVFASSVEKQLPLPAETATSAAAAGEALALVDAPAPFSPHVFLRGNPGNPGPEVPRQFLEVLARPERKPFQQGSGRLELARAIASADNPLTARVMVNRLWQHHFGAGLVRTPSEFGLRSDAPRQQDLLDWLAARFVADGWSLKMLHRTIALSSTYQQSSNDRPEGVQRDADNFLLWKMNRKRLDFEALRDSLLAAGAGLDATLGGPSIDLFAPPYTRRRAAYAYIDRQNLPGTLRTFDFANPDTHSPQRFITTVPQQALFLLNNPLVAEQAQALAGRTEAAGGDPATRVEQLYRLALGRAPRADERQIAVEFVRAEPTPTPGAASVWEKLAQVLLLSNEFAFVD